MNLMRRIIHCGVPIRSSHPLRDEMADEFRCAFKRHVANKSGVLYIAINPVLHRWHKLGFTRKGLDARMGSLKSAGVLGLYHPIASWPVIDAPFMEVEAKKRLKPYCVDGELYWIDYESMIKTVGEVVSDTHHKIKSVLNEAALYDLADEMLVFESASSTAIAASGDNTKCIHLGGPSNFDLARVSNEH